tara:strand:+ start:726 stop:1025 length:300 start_codon:yes stop_codon:yes gene_type:complete
MEDKENYIEDDSFTEAVDSLVETMRDLIVKPIKRVTGFITLGFLLIALLIMSIVFFFMGSLKIVQGLGFSLGLNPAGFAMAMLGFVFLVLAARNYRKNK